MLCTCILLFMLAVFQRGATLIKENTAWNEDVRKGKPTAGGWFSSSPDCRLHMLMGAWLKTHFLRRDLSLSRRYVFSRDWERKCVQIAEWLFTQPLLRLNSFRREGKLKVDRQNKRCAIDVQSPHKDQMKTVCPRCFRRFSDESDKLCSVH